MSEPTFYKPGFVDLDGKPIHNIPIIGRAAWGHDQYVVYKRRGSLSRVKVITVYSDALYRKKCENYPKARKVAGIHNPGSQQWEGVTPEQMEKFLQAYFSDERIRLVRVLRHTPAGSWPVWGMQYADVASLSNDSIPSPDGRSKCDALPRSVRRKP